jgi:hypothetical protein
VLNKLADKRRICTDMVIRQQGASSTAHTQKKKEINLNASFGTAHASPLRAAATPFLR